MDSAYFSTRRAIRNGWTALRENYGMFLALLATWWVVAAVPFAMAQASGSAASATVLGIVGYVVSSATWLGVIKFTLHVTEGERGGFSDLFACFPLVPSFIASSLIYALIINAVYLGAGIVVMVLAWTGVFQPTPLIVAALGLGLVGVVINLGIRFYFYVYYIVADGDGPIQALKSSSELTEGARGQLFLFGLALIGLNLLGALAGLILFGLGIFSGKFGVALPFLAIVGSVVMMLGVLVTAPISLFAVADVFRQLRGDSRDEEPEEAEPATEIWPHRRV